MVRSKESVEAEYFTATPASRAQWEQAKEVLPGGIGKGTYWKPPYPIFVERGDGCHIWDLDGNRYVDFSNHQTAMMLGHNHPAVVEAVGREIERGIGLGWPTELEAEIAEEIVGRFPSVEKVRFTNSGLESSLHAGRMARAITGKPKLAKFDRAYHGGNDSLDFNSAGQAEYPRAHPGHIGMPPGSSNQVLMLPYGDTETVDLILKGQADQIAAVFFDGKPGMIDSPPEFTHSLREITEDLGILLIVDEVISFRVAYGGYQGLVGVRPDISIFGKAFGGGLPVGVIGGRADLMDVLDNTGEPTGLNQSGTFSGNSFTLAAGLATLRVLTPQAYEHLDRLRAHLHDGLLRAFADAGMACTVQSAGSLIRPYFEDDSITDGHGDTDSVDAMLHRINIALMLKGQYVRARFPEFSLSLPMEERHIDGVLSALAEVLGEHD